MDRIRLRDLVPLLATQVLHPPPLVPPSSPARSRRDGSVVSVSSGGGNRWRNSRRRPYHSMASGSIGLCVCVYKLPCIEIKGATVTVVVLSF